MVNIDDKMAQLLFQVIYFQLLIYKYLFQIIYLFQLITLNYAEIDGNFKSITDYLLRERCHLLSFFLLHLCHFPESLTSDINYFPIE